MGTIERARRILTRLQAVPGLHSAIDRYYERQFCNWPGSFRGIYASFDEAVRAAPKGLIGYDHPALGAMYAERRFRIFEADYPVLFWLSRTLTDAPQVFDFGGHVGLAFYGFEAYLDYPPELAWTVYDVPSVLAEGRKLAERHPRAALRFTGELSALKEHAVFHASGALQYVETPLAQQLTQLSARPKHLLLNKLPLYDGKPYVTLQNTVHSYNPYAVYNRAEFIASLEALGYRLIDAWDDFERSCRPLNQPPYHVPHYTGLYLRHESVS